MKLASYSQIRFSSKSSVKEISGNMKKIESLRILSDNLWGDRNHGNHRRDC